MTIGLVFICILIAISLFISIVGLGERCGDYIIGGIVMLLFSGVCLGVRADKIEKEELKLACIKEGKEVVKILDSTVCKL